jgi:hypothetical protein
VQRVSDIEKAIDAHAHWASFIRKAVVERKSSIDLESIRADNRCEFGKWLHGVQWLEDGPAKEAYWGVRELHAEFHEVSARVVELALSGKIVKAYTLLYGEYLTMSGRLVIAMRTWQSALLKEILSRGDNGRNGRQ